MPLLCERQQKFKLVDQERGPKEYVRKSGRAAVTITTAVIGQARQKPRRMRAASALILFSYRMISHPY
jgi:hypothetical protein